MSVISLSPRGLKDVPGNGVNTKQLQVSDCTAYVRVSHTQGYFGKMSLQECKFNSMLAFKLIPPNLAN